MGTSGFLLINKDFQFILFPNNGKEIVLPTSFLFSGKAADVATPLGHFLQSDPWQSARLLCLCLSWKPRRTGGCWWETECGRHSDVQLPCAQRKNRVPSPCCCCTKSFIFNLPSFSFLWSGSEIASWWLTPLFLLRPQNSISNSQILQFLTKLDFLLEL